MVYRVFVDEGAGVDGPRPQSEGSAFTEFKPFRTEKGFLRPPLWVASGNLFVV